MTRRFEKTNDFYCGDEVLTIAMPHYICERHGETKNVLSLYSNEGIVYFCGDCFVELLNGLGVKQLKVEHR